MIPNEVFLSHSGDDEEFVTSVASILRRHGISVWYSKTNIRGGQKWHDEIGVALNRCDWFVLILSPNSVNSKWVKRELLFALQENRFENKIVPLLYKECEFANLSWVLPSFQIIDFQYNLDEGYRELLRIWELGYAA